MTEKIGKYPKVLYCLSVFFILIASAPNSMAEMYKWVDKNGITRFSDTRPAEENPKVETLPTYKTDESDSDIPEDTTPETGNDSSVKKSPPVNKKKVRKDATVEVYVTSWCKWCKKTKSFFQSRGISFAEYDIEKDKEAARRREKLDSGKGVPFTVINGKGIPGYNEKAFEDALNNQTAK